MVGKLCDILTQYEPTIFASVLVFCFVVFVCVFEFDTGLI